MEIIVAGAGIGGLATALFLNRAGQDVRVFEAAPEIHELGVGINVQPHAIKELSTLGLQDELLAAGNSCLAWGLFNKFGQEIWQEPRGLAEGHDWPQVSIHRGRLQGILLAAARRALGEDRIVADARLTGFDDTADGVVARFTSRDGAETEVAGDALIGADGIHSRVREIFYPDEGAPVYSGAVLWRGITETVPHLGGHTMIIAGHKHQKFIAYPITGAGADGRATVNWLAELHFERMLNREDWNRPGRLEDFLPAYESWKFDWLDVPGMIRGAEAVYEFPMVDRDPLPRWTFGRVTLLGDAAHPMYPIGANGASQAIRDASALAGCFAAFPADAAAALADYEDQRREAVNKVVVSNRQLGPEQVMQIAEERAPDGFGDIEDVIPRAELEEISGRYLTITTGVAKGNLKAAAR